MMQEKQFTILKVLLNSDDKLTHLNEAERRSLALLKKANPCIISPGYESGDCPSPSDDASINITDATDLDDDDGSVNYRAKWKRVSHLDFLQYFLLFRVFILFLETHSQCRICFRFVNIKEEKINCKFETFNLKFLKIPPGRHFK